MIYIMVTYYKSFPINSMGSDVNKHKTGNSIYILHYHNDRGDTINYDLLLCGSGNVPMCGSK